MKFKKNYEFIYINTNLTTNFKPKNIFNNFNQIFTKNSKQVFCKNFLIFILLIKHQHNIFNKSHIHVKKYKKKVYTILRSPYRHKLARHQININRYNVNNSIKIKTKKLKIKNWKSLIKYITFLKNFNKFFESNIMFVNNIKISIPFRFKSIFLLKKYN